MALAPGIEQALIDIVGRDHVRFDPNLTRRYSGRACALIHAVPDAVVFPGSTAEVLEVLRGAYTCGVPVVERSATWNRSAATALLAGGIVLALDRMNRILDFDAREAVARIQPGVSAEQLHAATAAAGVRTIRADGGAGGDAAGGWPHCRVLGLEAVLPTGKIARAGGGLLASDVDNRQFAQLVVGHDGTLAVITELTLALVATRTLDTVGAAATLPPASGPMVSHTNEE